MKVLCCVILHSVGFQTWIEEANIPSLNELWSFEKELEYKYMKNVAAEITVWLITERSDLNNNVIVLALGVRKWLTL